MSEPIVREAVNFSNEEITLACETARRRLAGMFSRARHPKWRSPKGRRKATYGMIYARTRDLRWLEDYAVREIHASSGPLATPSKRRIVKRVLREMTMTGTIGYREGAWHMDADYMEACLDESRAMSSRARERKQRERQNNGYVPPVRRSRRSQPSLA